MKPLATIHSIPKRDMRRIAPFLPAEEPVLTGKRIIPVCEPSLNGNEERYVREALKTSWISSVGEYVDRFERVFARKVSRTKYAFAVNSGTSALHVALLSLGIGPGDEVIVPAFTMVATINAVLYCGATPVLVDSDPTTWNMDPIAVEAAVTKRTKAIVPVHIYGLPADMKRIGAIARKHGLRVVEDSAEALGAEVSGKRAGSFGDVSAFSLYANKTITTGEGGMVVTDSPDIARRIELIRRHAFSTERHFWHTMVGYSYCMTNMQAAVGCAQVERFDALVAAKRKHAALYGTLLGGIPGITLPVEPKGFRNVFWMYGILVDKDAYGIDKNVLRERLAAKGIETRSFFVPMHFQPVHYARYKGLRFPVAERLCRDGLYLPSSAVLSDADIRFVADTVRSMAVRSA